MRALVSKDAAELARNPGALVPSLIMAIASLVPAFLISVAAPMLSGESLADGEEFSKGAALAAQVVPELSHLRGAALVQAFVFHQFAWFILMVPVVSSIAVAAHALIGEKVARTLEPLLATPISTAELLAAKAATPFILAMSLMWATLVVYVTGVALVAEPGVWHTFLGPRTLMVFLVLGPLFTIVAELLAVIVSSRVNDPRSAQQVGVVLVLPITAAFVGQLIGQSVLGAGALWLSALGLAVLGGILLWVGARTFDRERILMRWR